MIQTSGNRELDSVEKFSKYSVLPQNPWLLNATGYFNTKYRKNRYSSEHFSKGQHPIWPSLQGEEV